MSGFIYSLAHVPNDVFFIITDLLTLKEQASLAQVSRANHRYSRKFVEHVYVRWIHNNGVQDTHSIIQHIEKERCSHTIDIIIDTTNTNLREDTISKLARTVSKMEIHSIHLKTDGANDTINRIKDIFSKANKQFEPLLRNISLIQNKMDFTSIERLISCLPHKFSISTHKFKEQGLNPDNTRAPRFPQIQEVTIRPQSDYVFYKLLHDIPNVTSLNVDFSKSIRNPNVYTNLGRNILDKVTRVAISGIVVPATLELDTILARTPNVEKLAVNIFSWNQTCNSNNRSFHKLRKLSIITSYFSYRGLEQFIAGAINLEKLHILTVNNPIFLDTHFNHAQTFDNVKIVKLNSQSTQFRQYIQRKFPSARLEQVETPAPYQYQFRRQISVLEQLKHIGSYIVGSISQKILLLIYAIKRAFLFVFGLLVTNAYNAFRLARHVILGNI